MELKEILLLLKKESKLFFGTLLFFLVVGLFFFSLEKERLVANLMINVTRKGVQQTEDYRYDDFYRLQADERFADTVVRWLDSPSITNEVAKEAGIKETIELEAKRLSSQMIEVTFETADKEKAERISDAIKSSLDEQIRVLDESQKEETWFALVYNSVELSDARVPGKVVFPAALLLGLFFGFFGVLLKHYLKQ